MKTNTMKMNIKALQEDEDVCDLFTNAEAFLDGQTDSIQTPRTNPKAKPQANTKGMTTDGPGELNGSSNFKPDPALVNAVRQTQSKKKAVEAAKTDVEYEKLQESIDLKKKLEATDIGNLHAQQQTPEHHNYLRDQLKAMLDKKSTGLKFISDVMEKEAPLLPGQVTVVCAGSGSGKTTTMVHIALQNIKAGKRVLHITNEEAETTLRTRLACASLGISANAFLKGELPDYQDVVQDTIVNQTSTLSVLADPAVTKTMEGVMMAIRSAASKGYDLVLIDYFQLITVSTKVPGLDPTQVGWRLKSELQSYTSEGNLTPVIIAAQVYDTESKDMLERNLEQRLKWCKGLKEAASVFLEVVRITDTKISVFCIDKTRFGETKSYHHHIFSNGEFKAATKQDVVRELTAAKERAALRKTEGADEAIKGDEE